MSAAVKAFDAQVQSIRGFTLIEVLIVSAVLIMLMTVALPVASGVLMKSGVDTAQNEFTNALALGQVHSKRLANDVFLCAGTVQDQCQTKDWTQGMSLFNIDMESTTQVLTLVRAFDPLPVGVQLLFAERSIRISKHGSFIDGPHAVTICNPKLEDFWVEINISGFIIEDLPHHFDGEEVNCSVAG